MSRAMRWLREHLVLILGILVLAYTFVPIAVVILMSFNQPKSRLVYKFDSFTLQNWLHPCADPSMCHAVVKSIEIGLLATIFATILGSMMAFVLIIAACAATVPALRAVRSDPVGALRVE